MSKLRCVSRQHSRRFGVVNNDVQCVLDAGRCGTNRSAQHYTARRGFEHRKFLQDANFKLIISDGKKRKRTFFLILLGSKYLIEDINRYEVYVYTR